LIPPNCRSSDLRTYADPEYRESGVHLSGGSAHYEFGFKGFTDAGLSQVKAAIIVPDETVGDPLGARGS